MNAPGGEQLYEISTTVLESPDQGPMLCPGGVATSLPPQCGNVDITNWSWDDVEGEERVNGTIWGEFHVVGTYDGRAFTVTDAGPARPPTTQPNFEIEAPCPDPDGGWQVRDPSRASESDVDPVAGYVRRQPDHSGVWLDHDGGLLILTAAFTGDLERHRAEIEEIWGGPLCVWRHERPYSELARIQTELSQDALRRDFGLELLGSSVDEVRNRIDLSVFLADADDRAAIDARYGEGTVIVTSALTPVA
jgi:hypothetical protein